MTRTVCLGLLIIQKGYPPIAYVDFSGLNSDSLLLRVCQGSASYYNFKLKKYITMVDSGGGADPANDSFDDFNID